MTRPQIDVPTPIFLWVGRPYGSGFSEAKNA